MATLLGTKIKDTYAGLLKTSDNAAIDGNLKNIEDGAGNATPLSMANDYVQLQAPTIELIESTGGTNLIQLSATETYFEGTVNFTNATVTGLPGGSPGLVAGTATDSMRSSDDLTATAPSANGAGAIALGAGSTANNTRGVAIGFSADANENAVAIGTDTNVTQFSVGIGQSSYALANYSVAVGRQTQTTGANSIALGYFAKTDSQGNIAIGHAANSLGGGGFERGNIAIGKSASVGVNSEKAVIIGIGANGGSGNRQVAVGNNATSTSSRTVAVGVNTISNAFGSVCIGNYSSATGESAIAIGGYSNVASGTRSMVFGRESTANAEDAVAIGYQITASTPSTVTMKRLQLLDYASLNYADDTAAATGGIPLGGVYHTNGAMKIRVA